MRTAQPRIKLLVRNLCIFNQNNGVKRQESYLSVGHTFFFKRFDERDRFFYALVFEKMDIPCLQGKVIGVTTKDGKPIYLEDWMETKPIHLDPSHVGVYIPHEELMRRPKYNYYAHLNAEQVFRSQCIFI